MLKLAHKSTGESRDGPNSSRFRKPWSKTWPARANWILTLVNMGMRQYEWKIIRTYRPHYTLTVLGLISISKLCSACSISLESCYQPSMLLNVHIFLPVHVILLTGTVYCECSLRHLSRSGCTWPPTLHLRSLYLWFRHTTRTPSVSLNIWVAIVYSFSNDIINTTL